jgi:peptide/nickel transport system substrate-binding protein
VPAGGTRRVLVAAALSAALLGAAGCDGGDREGAPAPSGNAAAGTGGALVWALADRPAEVDPLLATRRSDQLVTRQVHEPLVEQLAAPFGDARRLPGLAVSSGASAGYTIWHFALRQGVRFQDGTPFNAGAVLANAERWRTTTAGRALLPDLFAADAPRPDLVRFFLDRPDPDFPARLSDPRLGIVSPRALVPRRGSGARMAREERSGTGPFELRERDAGGALVARNLAWWGSDRGLGPALDQVQFRVSTSADGRLALLEAGDVQVAEALGPSEAREARRNPLLEILRGAGASLGLERSVRGITSAREIPSLSGVWVARVGGG